MKKEIAILLVTLVALSIAGTANSEKNVTIGTIQKEIKPMAQNVKESDEGPYRVYHLDDPGNAYANVKEHISSKVAQINRIQNQIDGIVSLEEKLKGPSAKNIDQHSNENTILGPEIRQEMLNLVSEIPLEGELSPGEAKLKTLIKIIGNDKEQGIRMEEMESVNDALKTMQGELNELDTVSRKYQYLDGFESALAAISLIGIYTVFKKRRGKKEYTKINND